MDKKYCSLVLILLIIALTGCIEIEFPKNETMIQTTNITPVPTLESVIREPGSVNVKIIGSSFDPLELRIINGTIVKWENFDSGMHAISFHNVSSPPFNKRESWSYRFNETGTFEYNCTIHTWMKHGKIVVR